MSRCSNCEDMAVLVEHLTKAFNETRKERDRLLREKERRIEHETTMVGDVAVPQGPKKTSWTADAGDMWQDRFGEGTANYPAIAKHLKTLVKAQTWAVVRPVWEHYLVHQDPKFLSVPQFVVKFAYWQEQSGLAKTPTASLGLPVRGPWDLA